MLVDHAPQRGPQATTALARLYAVSRLYINFFQPSFKLKSKVRDGARIVKHYHPPETPYERLLSHSSVDEAAKDKLRAQFDQLDPVQLLQQIRVAQQELAQLTTSDGAVPETSSQCNRSLIGVLLPPTLARNNSSHVHHGGGGSDPSGSDQRQVAAA